MDKISARGGYKFGFSGSKDDFKVYTTDEGVSFGGGLQLPWGSGADNSVYIGLLLQDLARELRWKAGDRLPPVLPLVLYNGTRPWAVPRQVAEAECSKLSF